MAFDYRGASGGAVFAWTRFPKCECVWRDTRIGAPGSRKSLNGRMTRMTRMGIRVIRVIRPFRLYVAPALRSPASTHDAA